MAKLIDIKLPESDQEGTQSILENWMKQIGDRVEAHEPLVEISTDKVSMEVAAPEAGVLREILVQGGEEITTDAVIGRIEIGATQSAPAENVADKKSQKIEKRASRRKKPVAGIDATLKLTPRVRLLLETHDIDPKALKGTGRGGRITAADVEEWLADGNSGRKKAPANKAAAKPKSGIPGKMVKHSATRLMTARHMVDSLLQTAPHVTAIFDLDMTSMLADRKKRKPDFAKKDVKLTFTAYFVQAAVKAMQAVPETNSRWHEDALEIYESCNIGIAAATDAGLVVPVLHNAQKLDLFETARQLQALTTRAREGKMKKEDVQKGTFTITNHGTSGSLIATPIINQPQSAILGIGKMEKRVVVVEKNGKDVSEIKPMCYVTLTIDHRALDGFQANQFLTAFVNALQL
ncbi:MAG: dihydrolipoamide acetyltransferase family protein [Calditrichia bacterium]